MKSFESESQALLETLVTVHPRYSHATLQVRRDPVSRRLRATVASYEPGNPDPVRVECGALATLAPSLRRRHPDIVDVTLATLNAAGVAVETLHEVFMDMDPDGYWNSGDPYAEQS